MIKLNDIRVDNYILFKPFGKGKGKIGQIKPGDFGRIAGDDPENSEYHPIPLTSVWFKRLGFTKKETSTIWMLAIDYIGTDYPCTLQLSGSGIQVCRSGIGAACAPVFHVHQLQNLYYSLTGNELKVKEFA